jgi:hypothetical protein
VLKRRFEMQRDHRPIRVVRALCFPRRFDGQIDPLVQPLIDRFLTRLDEGAELNVTRNAYELTFPRCQPVRRRSFAARGSSSTRRSFGYFESSKIGQSIHQTHLGFHGFSSFSEVHMDRSAAPSLSTFDLSTYGLMFDPNQHSRIAVAARMALRMEKRTQGRHVRRFGVAATPNRYGGAASR